MAATITFETLPRSTIRAYGDNPRRHSRQQIRRLHRSIEEYGFVNPILVDEANVVIAGHGRLEAAGSAGLEAVPAIRLSGLSPAQKSALRIADNRLAEKSTWSPELLKKELEFVISCDFDAELTGFDDIEIDARLTIDGAEADDEPAIAPPPERPVSRRGDLWKVGEHRILCGDSRERSSYERLLGSDTAVMTIADPPFNIAVADISGLGRHKHDEFAMASGEMSPAEFTAFLRTVAANCRDMSADGSLHYWFSDWRVIADLVHVGREVFTEHKNIIVWAKPNAGMGSQYRSQHELIALFKHGRGKHVNNIQLGRTGRSRTNVWQYPGASGFSATRDDDLASHPTVKPTRMIADAIRDASDIGDLVLDPFGGSGTTMLAAQQVGRRAALIEIEPRYVDVTLRRFTEATGVEPRLAPDLMPHSAVRWARNGSEESDHGR